MYYLREKRDTKSIAIIGITALLFLSVQHASAQESWPSSWNQMLTASWASMTDPTSDHNPSDVDIINDGAPVCSYFDASSSMLFFRMALGDDPINGGKLKPYAWQVEIDVDGDGVQDWNVRAGGITEKLYVYYYPGGAETATFTLNLPVASGYVRSVPNGSVYYLDIQAPFSAFQKSGYTKNIYSDTPFRMFYHTSTAEAVTIKDATVNSTDISGAFALSATQTIDGDGAYGYVYDTRDLDPYSTNGTWNSNETITVSGTGWPPSSAAAGVYNNGERGIRITNSGGTPLWTGTVTTSADGVLSSAPTWKVPASAPSGAYAIHMEDPRSSGTWHFYDSLTVNQLTISEMDLVQGTIDITDGGSYDYGSKASGTDTDVVFTIKNTGTAPLTLTTPLSITGTNADQFSIESQPTGPVAAGGSTTFTVRFTPTSTGSKTATISITNGDSDENPYDLTLNGTGTAPEMDLVQGTTDVADGGSYDFGGRATGSDTDVVFTIRNTGNAPLTLTTPLTISGADADQFSIQSQPTGPVAAGGSTTFTVRFTPTSTGGKTASISIANNDGNENPYNLTLNGTGTAPEFDLVQGTTDVADGGSYNFGTKATGTTTDIVFTIKNTGTGNLNFVTPISLAGAGADQFSIQSQPTGPVAAGGSTTFTVRFAPTSAGAKTASISIANNDSNENPYNLTLTGTGQDPLAISGTPDTTVAAGSSYSFTPSASGGKGPYTFSIQNKPSWATFDPSTGKLSGTPAAGDAGTYSSIIISVTDDNSTTVSLDPFKIIVTAPEMDLAQGTTDIADGGSYNFDTRTTSTATDVIFTIRNTGSAPLSLTTPLTITGTGADQFSIQSQPTGPVAAGGSTTFTVRFAPTSAGAKTASISIANNDSNENPYNLTLTGTGQDPLAISGIPDTTVAAGSSYSFTPSASGGKGPYTFSIQNKPSWATFDPSTGKLSGTPAAGDAGTYSSIIISVTDDNSTTVSLDPFKITVTAPADDGLERIEVVVYCDDDLNGTKADDERGVREIRVIVSDTLGHNASYLNTNWFGTCVTEPKPRGIYHISIDSDDPDIPAGYVYAQHGQLTRVKLDGFGAKKIFFGLVPVSGDEGTIAGYTWHDADWNRQWDEQEHELPFVKILLYKSVNGSGAAHPSLAKSIPGSTAVDSMMTDHFGKYIFPKLAAGAYLVRANYYGPNPEGVWVITSSEERQIVLAEGEHCLQTNFGFAFPGEAVPGRISGFIFNDTNRNTRQEDGEAGLGGITVYLKQGDAVVAAVVTSADGAYDFTDIPPGDYTIAVDASTLPEGFSRTGSGDETGVFLAAADTHEYAPMGYAAAPDYGTVENRVIAYYAPRFDTGMESSGSSASEIIATDGSDTESILGRYDCSDRDVLEYHILLAWASGIDGFAVNWPGKESRETETLRTMLHTTDELFSRFHAHGFDFEIAVVFQDGDSSRLAENTLYLRDSVLTSESYWGKRRGVMNPLFVNRDSIPQADISAIRARIGSVLPGDCYLVADGDHTLDRNAADVFYPWLTTGFDTWDVSGMDWGESYLDSTYQWLLQRSWRLSYPVGTVWPGYHAPQSHNGSEKFIARQDSLVYINTWEKALAHESTHWLPLVMLETWNDYATGTGVEPASDVGYLFTKLTRDYARLYKSSAETPVGVDDLGLLFPQHLYQARKAIAAGFGDPEDADGALRQFFLGNNLEAVSMADAAGGLELPQVNVEEVGSTYLRLSWNGGTYNGYIVSYAADSSAFAPCGPLAPKTYFVTDVNECVIDGLVAGTVYYAAVTPVLSGLSQTDFTSWYESSVTNSRIMRIVTQHASTDVVMESGYIPSGFSLSQNYPNPFNPVTHIEYSLPSQQHVTLVLYDVQGREIRTIVDAVQAAGQHRVTIDAADLSSGLYMYSINTEEFRAIRKMILMK